MHVERVANFSIFTPVPLLPLQLYNKSVRATTFRRMKTREAKRRHWDKVAGGSKKIERLVTNLVVW